MMKSLFILLITSLIGGNNNLIAQTEYPSMSLDSNTISVSGQINHISSTISLTETSVNWVQYTENAIEENIFNITNVSGNWNSNLSEGQLYFELSQEEYLAQLEITGSPSGISAQLIFVISNTQQEIYTLQITNITYL